MKQRLARHLTYARFSNIVFDPVSNMRLLRDDSCHFPVTWGVAHPVIRDIPVAGEFARPLATALRAVSGG